MGKNSFIACAPFVDNSGVQKSVAPPPHGFLIPSLNLANFSNETAYAGKPTNNQ
jgi:hypothetical protein